jgi:hypothetical protein
MKVRLTADDAGELSGVYIVRKVLPGQRDASLLWNADFSEVAKAIGFEQSKVCPAIYGMGRTASLMIHVDDGVMEGPVDTLMEQVVPALKSKYNVSVQGPFMHEGDGFDFMKRSYRLVADGLLIGLDEKYCAKLVEITKCPTRLKKRPCHPDLNKKDPTSELSPESSTMYRSGVGILLYMSPDKAELQFCIKCLAGWMSKPTKRAWECLVHCVQYLQGVGGHCLKMYYTVPGMTLAKRVFCEDALNDGSSDPNEEGEAATKHALETLTDTDWAGDQKERKSTTSAHQMMDGNLLFSFARNQKGIALSSTEAEYYGASSGASEGIYLKSIQEHLTGQDSVEMKLRIDNSAARQLIQRTGVSKIRHIEARMLWLQDKHKEKVLGVQAVATAWNTADLGTKSLSAERMNMLLFMIGTVDADCNDQPVGKKEFEQEMEKQASKQQIRQICMQMCEPRVTRTMTSVNVRMAKALLALHGFTMVVEAERLESDEGVCGLEDGGDDEMLSFTIYVAGVALGTILVWEFVKKFVCWIVGWWSSDRDRAEEAEPEREDDPEYPVLEGRERPIDGEQYPVFEDRERQREGDPQEQPEEDPRNDPEYLAWLEEEHRDAMWSQMTPWEQQATMDEERLARQPETPQNDEPDERQLVNLRLRQSLRRSFRGEDSERLTVVRSVNSSIVHFTTCTPSQRILTRNREEFSLCQLCVQRLLETNVCDFCERYNTSSARRMGDG